MYKKDWNFKNQKELLEFKNVKQMKSFFSAVIGRLKYESVSLKIDQEKCPKLNEKKKKTFFSQKWTYQIRTLWQFLTVNIHITEIPEGKI